MNKETIIKIAKCATAIAIVLMLFLSLKSNRDLRKERDKAITEKSNYITEDSIKSQVVTLSEAEMELAKNKTIKLIRDSIELLKNDKRIKVVDKIAYVKQIYRDTVRINANYAKCDSHAVALDTTIYRPWTEVHLQINDSILIDFTTRSELIVTFGTQKYDTHKSWIGRLLHRDKSRSVAYIQESNPHIILEQTEFIQNDK